MKLELEQKDLDTIAEKVSERIFERILPYLDGPGRDAGEKRLYSIKEAALILGRGPWAVRHMIRENKLPCVRDGVRVFIEAAALDSWIANRKAES